MLIKDQAPLPYASINVAQINEALDTYSQEQVIVDGLTALRTDILKSIPNAKDCVQCGAAGTIEKGTKICPLCNGMTKTAGQYKILYGPVLGYDPL